MLRCDTCGDPIQAHVGAGRPRVYCRPCGPRAAYRAWRLNNLTKARRDAAEWARENPEQRRALNLKSGRERRLRDPARMRALARAQRDKHRVLIQATARAWRVKNRERVRAAARTNYRRRRDAGHDHGKGTHRSRARRFGAPWDYGIKPLQVFAADGWCCQLCGCSTPRQLRGSTDPRAPELDHIVPLSVRGGPGHVRSNVQTSCRRCNGKKGSTSSHQARNLP